jgi:Leucine-rich repeat (LRR) protein
LENLKSLPEFMHTLFPSLTDLTITNCPQLESFSNEGLPPSLKRMRLIGCSKFLIASLKWALGINTYLKSLYIENVDVESFPDQGLLPLSLTSLYIYGFPNLKKLNYKGICHLSSLEEVHLADCPSLQCLPVEGLPKSISTLEIRHCRSLKQRCKKPEGEDWGKISHIQSVMIDGDIIT